MRVLITRPKEQAEATAERLHAMGHKTLFAPMLEIRLRDGEPISLDRVQAVIATSVNGIRALARRSPERSIVMYTVGTRTAAVARAFGYTNVLSAEGDARDIAELVAANVQPERGALLHATGAHRDPHLAQTLRAKGFTLREEVLYDAVAERELPDEIAGSLQRETIDAMLLFSRRSAEIFAAAVERAGLSRACSRVDAICISEAVAEIARRLPFRTIHNAASPDVEAMLALLGTGGN